MVRMVDVAEKEDVKRRATAQGELKLKPSTLSTIKSGKAPKGDVLVAAEIAALQAIKKTWEVIPHCHPIPVTFARVNLNLTKESVTAIVEVEATYKTGVEMEALYGVSIALLTVWDMVKKFEKDKNGQYPSTKIEQIKLSLKVRGDEKNIKASKGT